MDINIENNITEPVKAPKAGAIFRGILEMTVYLVIVSIPQIFVLIPVIYEAITEAGLANYNSVLIEKMAEHGTAVTVSTVIGTAIAVLVMFIWYFFGVYKKNVKNGTHESVLPKLKNPKAVLFVITSSVAGYALADLIMELTLKIMPAIADAYLQSMGVVVGGVNILGYVLTLVLAPIGEELCLRGLFLSRARLSFGLVGCMILSGVYFGIYHMNPIQGLYAIPIGMLFGFIAYKFKSVIPCIIAHFINNLMAGLSGVLRFDLIAVPIIVLVVFGAVAVVLGLKVDFFRTKISEE